MRKADAEFRAAQVERAIRSAEASLAAAQAYGTAYQVARAEEALASLREMEAKGKGR